MKKFLCLLLCLVLASLTLVGCGEKVIGEQLDEYEKEYPDVNKKIEDVKLNLYIVVEDETAEYASSTANTEGSVGVITTAINTVNNAIKQFTDTNYHSEVNVIYVKASDYNSVVLNAVNSDDSNAANIVLVNSYALMYDLYATGKLCALDAFLDTTDYGRLNTAIPKALIDASRLAETVDGKKVNKLYTIPNNHVIGSYEYLLINKSVTRDYANFSEAKVLGYTSYEDAAELISVIEADGRYNPADLVSLVPGSYEDKAMYESLGYYCNIVEKPIADKNEAFSSAFAIVDRGELLNNRSMQIIYELNTNEEFRNLLQYGVSGTNYIPEKDEYERVISVVRDDSENNRYYMNLIYTGSIFTAYHCEEIGWNAEVEANAEKQNADSITYVTIVEEEDVTPPESDAEQDGGSEGTEGDGDESGDLPELDEETE